jgi:hypothetical protein
MDEAFERGSSPSESDEEEDPAAALADSDFEVQEQNRRNRPRARTRPSAGPRVPNRHDASGTAHASSRNRNHGGARSTRGVVISEPDEDDEDEEGEGEELGRGRRRRRAAKRPRDPTREGLRKKFRTQYAESDDGVSISDEEMELELEDEVSHKEACKQLRPSLGCSDIEQ